MYKTIWNYISKHSKKSSTASVFLPIKQVQNKMHWAAHKHTAAEVIYERWRIPGPCGLPMGAVLAHLWFRRGDRHRVAQPFVAVELVEIGRAHV